MRMKNTIRITGKPLKQQIEVTCRYDKTWKTYFMTFGAWEVRPQELDRGDEVVFCINSKEERDELIALIKKATKNIK